MYRFLFGASVAVLQIATTATIAIAQIVAVPPLIPAVGAQSSLKRAESLLTDGSRTQTVNLAPPTTTELSRIGATNAKSRATAAGKRVPLKIGIVRDAGGAGGTIGNVALDWQPVAGGSAARIEVTSPGAAAIRIGLAAMGSPSAGVAIRFVGAARTQQVFGPYAASDIGATSPYWSPVLEGESGTLEVFAPTGVDSSALSISIPKVAHLLVAGAGLRNAQSLKYSVTGGIGRAGACETDIKCVAPSAALTSAAASVAMTIVNDSSFVYECTATLTNDAVGSRTPYLYTANHCLSSDPAAVPRSTPAQLAATMNTYWFFDAVGCGDRTVPGYTLVAGGAKLLARSDDFDWALVQINRAPPAAANFSAWRAEPLAVGTIASVHHPQGDLKKFSRGSFRQYTAYEDGSSFATVGWTLGATEPGSSGAPLLTLNAQTGFYEMRGGLYGGDSSCSNPTATDDYSRLDVALPRIASYLTPSAPNPSALGTVVEFYSAELNDYFMTALPGEIDCLDTGCQPGWERTGLRFLAYTDPARAPADATPVCRFYVLPQFGNSHFYSADPKECAGVATQFGDAWVEESPNLFYIQLPNKGSGACPANTQPVYRFVNAATPLHHRYSAEVDVRNCMAYGMNPATKSIVVDLNCTVNKPGEWIQEGYGIPPDAPVMCAPEGGATAP